MSTSQFSVHPSRGDFLRLLAAGGVSAIGSSAMAALSSNPIATRPIPKGGAALPVVGVGTWQTFDIGNDPGDRREREEVLRILFEGGGSVIDSSPMYGNAEAVVGDLLSKMKSRDKAFLATKVWTQGKDDGIAQMSRSLQLLRTDRIELMQIHNLVDWETHLKTLRAWKEQGKFRYIGITHYTAGAIDDLAYVIRNEPVDFVQMAYSFAEPEAADMLLPLAADKQVAFIVNRPFAGGAQFRAVRGRKLPAFAAEFDCANWAQFFLKFVLGNPAVTCVIPGTDKPEYMRDNLAAGRGRLPDAAQRKQMMTLWQSL